MSQVDQWDRCTLGGVELPGHVALAKVREEIRKQIDSAIRFVFVLPAGYTCEIIEPNGDYLARWEGEEGECDIDSALGAQ